MKTLKWLASKLDWIIFFIGICYVLSMAYYDNGVVHKEIKSNGTEIMNASLDSVCVTDTDNTSTCIALDKKIYLIELESEGHNIYKLHVTSKE